jgi:predicted phage-related endonuclease
MASICRGGRGRAGGESRHMAEILAELLVADGAAAADDAEVLVEIYPKSGDQFQIIEELNAKIALRQELSGQIDQMVEEKKEIENQIKAVIGDQQGIKTSTYTVTWKSQDSNRVDPDALKSADLYEKFCKVTSTRVLRITKNKGA